MHGMMGSSQGRAGSHAPADEWIGTFRDIESRIVAIASGVAQRVRVARFRSARPDRGVSPH